MKQKRRLRTAACVLLAGTVLAAFVALAADAGSQGGPLGTLGFLNDTFLGQILEAVDQKLAQRSQEMTAQFNLEIQEREQALLGQAAGGSAGSAASFTAVELADGQTLHGSAGCQVLLRSGVAVCYSPDRSTPGLVDLTSGGSINDGSALEVNHLYMMTDSRGVTASGGPVTLLVLGDYALG